MNYLFPQFYLAQNFLPFPFTWLMPLLLWHIIWKGFALWHAARNQQRNWFITLLVINTAGILDILYLVFFQVNPDPANPWRSGTKTQSQSK